MARKAAALLIGINEFEDEYYQSSPLTTTHNNTRALKEILLDPKLGDLQEENITCLGNESGTVNGLMLEINRFFDASRWKEQGFTGQGDEYLLFYFTGHGKMQDGNFLFITKETKAGKGEVEEHTTLRGTDLARRIKRCSDELKLNIVVILDCCYGHHFYNKHCSEISSIYFLAASNSLAFDIDPQNEAVQEYSVFSRYLIQGLKNGYSMERLFGFIPTQQKDNHPHLWGATKLMSLPGQKRQIRVAHQEFHIVWPQKKDIESKELLSEEKVRDIETSYLEWLVNLHRDIKVISSNKFEQKTLLIPNESILVDLVESPEYLDNNLVEESRRFSQEAPGGIELEQNVTEAAIRPGAERVWSEKSFSDGEIITIPELLGKTNFAVLLGDPGSGKTTVARHITHEQAILYLKKGSWSEGVLFPIVISIADYADQYQQQNRQLNLSDFLGSPAWKRQEVYDNQGNTIEPDHLRLVLLDKIKKRRAMLIIDGLDEVDRYREDIIGEIERFAEQWVEKAVPSSDGLPPMRNVILATSRIIGYNARPLRNKGIKLVVVKGMSNESIQKFLRDFFNAYYLKTIPVDDTRTLRVKEDTEALWRQIYPESPLEEVTSSLLEISRNPMMLNIIANVYLSGRTLSLGKADLYHKFIDSFAGPDRRIGLTTEQLKMLLSEVAFHIHYREPNEVISQERLRQLLVPVFRTGRYNNTDVDSFIDLFSKEAGLLISKAKDVFGFPHRTIQEYLAACYCVRTEEAAIRSLQNYMYSPYWRGVVVFMLSELSRTYTPDVFLGIIKQLLGNETNNQLLPHTSFVFANHLNDLLVQKETSNSYSADNLEIITSLLKPLINAYTEAYTRGFGNFIYERIEQAVTNMAEVDRSALSDGLIVELKASPPSEPGFWGIAELVRKTGLLDRNIYRTLGQYVSVDRSDWRFPINTMLLDLVSEEFRVKEHRDNTELKWDSKSEREKAKGNQQEYDQRYRLFLQMLKFQHNQAQKNKLRLPVSIDQPWFGKKLNDAPGLLQVIYQHPHLLLLAAGLYGGYGNFGLKRWTEYYFQLVRFLIASDQQRKMIIRNDEAFFAGRFGYDDIVYSCAVYLDTYKPKVQQLEANEKLPRFQTRFIFRQSPLDKFMAQSVLSASKKGDIILKLKEIYKGSKGIQERTEAIAGLIALGSPIAEFEHEIRQDSRLLEEVSSRIRLMISGLEDAFLRSVVELNKYFNSEVRASSEMEMFLKLNLYIETLCRSSKAGVDTSSLIGRLPDELLPVFTADQLFGKLIANIDDPEQTRKVILDRLPKGVSLKQTLLSVAWAPNVKAAKYISTFRWEVPLPAPSAFSESFPLEVLDALEGLTGFDNLPSNQHIFRGGFIEEALLSMKDLYKREKGYLLEVDIFSVTFSDAHLNERTHRELAIENFDKYMMAWKKEVDQLLNPYLKARCLLQYLKRLNPADRKQPIDEVRSVLQSVSDGSKRARVLLKLLEYTIEESTSRLLLQDLREAIALTEHSEDRAVLYLRMADYYYNQPAALEEILGLCLESCENNRLSPLFFVQVMDTLKGRLTDFPALNTKYNLLLNKVGDPWVKVYLEGTLAAKWSYDLKPDDENIQGNVPFHLIASAYEALNNLNDDNHVETEWKRLVEEKGTPGAGKAFRKLLEAGRTNGIILTVSIAQQVEKWVEISTAEEQAVLLPLLNKPTRGAVAYVERWWLEKTGLLATIGLLCTIEQNVKVDESNIGKLMDLVSDPIELIRFRAELIFTAGVNKINTKGGRKFRVSILGKPVIEKVVEYTFLSDGGNISRVLRALFLYQVIHDSPQQLQNWIDEAASDISGNSVLADIILNNIVEVTEEAWKVLKENYEAGNPALREKLIVSLSFLSWDENPQYFTPGNCWNIIQGTHPQELTQKYLFDAWMVVYEFIKLPNEKIPVEQLNIQDIFKKRYKTISEITAEEFYKIAESKTHYGGSLIPPRKAGELKENYSDHLLRLLLKGLKETLDDPDLTVETTVLLDLLALFAPCKPVFLMNESYADGTLINKLLEFSKANDSLVARFAIMTLCRYLPVDGAELLEEIQIGLNYSDQDIRNNLEETVETIDPSILNGELLFDGLMEELNHQELKRVQIAAKMLATLVRRKSFKADLTIQVVDKLNSLISNPLSQQGLYELTGDGNVVSPLKISFIKRFDEALYELLLEVCGNKEHFER